MVFINPWASYKTEDIPDLNPHNDEEAKGCIGGIAAFCISSLIFIVLMYAAVALVNNNIINTKIMMIFVIVNIAIFVTLTIMLMKLSFKIVDKFKQKRKKIMVMKGKITFSGRICDFELITRKDLIERGYKYMEEVSGIFYKDYDIDFDVPKDKNFTEVKLTFNDGKEIKLDGTEVYSIQPTVRGTFTVYLPASLTPPFYEDVKKVEIK